MIARPSTGGGSVVVEVLFCLGVAAGAALAAVWGIGAARAETSEDGREGRPGTARRDRNEPR